jgi:ketosteroid isomerase-like protein
MPKADEGGAMTEHEHPNVALVRESADALQRGDTQWLADHMADDVVWHVGGNSRMAGEYRGKETVLQMTPTGGSNRIDVHDVLANDDHAVVLGTAHLEASDGDTVDYKFVNVFHLRDGKVTEAWGLAENDADLDPFFDKLAP